MSTPPPRPGFAAELRDAVTPRAVVLVLAVLGLQLGFIASYLGAFHSPKPHRVRVAVVAPAQARPAVLGKLNALPGEPVRASAAVDEPDARRQVLQRRSDAAFVLDPAGTSDTLYTASAAGPALATVVLEISRQIETAQHRQVTVVDLRPPAAGDGRGLSSFYLVIGWMVGGYLAASILGVAGGARPVSRHRVVIRLGALAAYAVASGIGGALITGPVLHALPGHFWQLAGIGTVVVFAAAAVTTALQVLLGVIGIGVAILLFVVLGNPSAGGAYPTALLPPFWRWIGPLLPPGAGTTTVRNTVYFGGHATGRAWLVLIGYAVAGVLLAVLAAQLRSGRQARTTA